jgi:hypothetical protein
VPRRRPRTFVRTMFTMWAVALWATRSIRTRPAVVVPPGSSTSTPPAAMGHRPDRTAAPRPTACLSSLGWTPRSHAACAPAACEAATPVTRCSANCRPTRPPSRRSPIRSTRTPRRCRMRWRPIRPPPLSSPPPSSPHPSTFRPWKLPPAEARTRGTAGLKPATLTFRQPASLHRGAGCFASQRQVDSVALNAGSFTFPGVWTTSPAMPQA